ncbi:MAG: hypothetical protein WC729_06345 [Sphingomonas sp.]|uniref:hypothetical protein n=1 Tax=Sphingomonas sp. TaxID=28214 RepID=UPI00356B4B2A
MLLGYAAEDGDTPVEGPDGQARFGKKPVKRVARIEFPLNGVGRAPVGVATRDDDPDPGLPGKLADTARCGLCGDTETAGLRLCGK